MKYSQDAGRLKVLAASLLFAPAVHAGGVQVTVRDGGGKPLADAVVFLESAAARLSAQPMAGVEVAQAAKQFAPQVTVVTAGTSVAFPNRDTVRHHVYSFSPAKTFELKLYTGTQASPVLFDKPGVVVLGCNIHDQMTAWVLVLQTPYFARTDARGVASMASVPPGNYRLRTWSPALPVGAAAADEPLQVSTSDLVASIKLAEVKP